MTDKERIKMLERRVAELESCLGATACDMLTGYIKNKLKSVNLGPTRYPYGCANKAANFERNCKAFLKSAFDIPGIRDLEYPMLKDAQAIVDMAVEIYKKQKIKQAQEREAEQYEQSL